MKTCNIKIALLGKGLLLCFMKFNKTVHNYGSVIEKLSALCTGQDTFLPQFQLVIYGNSVIFMDEHKPRENLISNVKQV